MKTNRYSRYDEYGLLHAPRHLVRAGKVDALKKILLDFDWHYIKLNNIGIDALIADYDLMQGETVFQLLQDTLRLSSVVLKEHKEQLAAQLLGRLGETENGEVISLLEQAIEYMDCPWLRPVIASLQPAGGSLIQNLPHADAVVAMALTPDEHFMLSATSNCEIKVWDITTGREICTLQDSQEEGIFHGQFEVTHLYTAAIAPVTSTHHAIKVWKTGSWTSVGEFEVSNYIHFFSIVNNAILLSADPNKIHAWNLASGRMLYEVECWSNPPTTLVVTLDGKYAIYGTEKYGISVREMANWKEVLQFNEHQGRINSLVMVPDGKHIISTDDYAADRDSVPYQTSIVWEIESGTVVKKYPALSRPLIMPDGKRGVFDCHDSTYRVLDIMSGAQFNIIPRTKANKVRYPGIGLPSEAVAVTPDGKFLICESDTRIQSLKVWDLTTGKEAGQLTGHGDHISMAITTKDCRYVFTASGDQTIKKWQLASLTPFNPEKALLPPHDAWITTVAVTPDRRYAISTNIKAIKLWNLDPLQEASIFYSENMILSITISPDGNHAVTTDIRGFISVWDLPSGTQVLSVKGPGDCYYVTTTPDCRFILTPGKNTFDVWDFSSGNLVKSFPRSGFPLVLPDGQSIVLASHIDCLLIRTQDWQITCLAEVETEEFKSIRSSKYGDELWPYALTPDGRYLIYGYSNKLKDMFNIVLMELDAGQIVYTLKGHNDLISSLVVTPDGKFLISLSADQTMQIRDLSTGELLQTVYFKFRSLKSVTVCAGGHYAYVLADNTFSVWEIPSLRRVGTFTGNAELSSAAVIPNYYGYVLGDRDGWVHFLSLENVAATPAIVTAWEFEDELVLGCPLCRTWSTIPGLDQNEVNKCPVCGTDIKLNQFTIQADWHPIAKAWETGEDRIHSDGPDRQ